LFWETGCYTCHIISSIFTWYRNHEQTEAKGIKCRTSYQDRQQFPNMSRTLTQKWMKRAYISQPHACQISTHWGSNIPKLTQLCIQKDWCRKPAQRWTLKQNWSHYQLTSGQSNLHRKEIMQNTATQTSSTIQEPNMRHQHALSLSK